MIKKDAIETLQIEADAVKNLINYIDDEFEATIRAILACKGRIVVTGMGKSGHVGKKIAASFASTGTWKLPLEQFLRQFCKRKAIKQFFLNNS